MTYSSGQLIDDADYNSFVWGDSTGSGTMNISNNIHYLWGPGRADRGINQSMTDLIPGLPGSTSGSIGGTTYNDRVGTLSPVSAGTDIRAQQWIGFFSALNRLRYYQDGSTGNVALSPQPGFGQTISVQALVSSKLLAANSWYANPSANQGVTVTSVSDSKSVNIQYPNFAGVVRRGYTRTISWSSGDQIRWFFNSGGRIRISVSGSTAGGVATDRSIAMATTLNQFGEATIDAYNLSVFTGNDFPTNAGAGTGYWRLGTTYKPIGTNTLGAGTYSDSFVIGYARVQDTAGNGSDNGAVGKSIQILIVISSGFGGTGTLPAWATDSLNVNLNMSIDVIDRTGSGAVISKTWSNPSVSDFSIDNTYNLP